MENYPETTYDSIAVSSPHGLYFQISDDPLELRMGFNVYNVCICMGHSGEVIDQFHIPYWRGIRNSYLLNGGDCVFIMVGSHISNLALFVLDMQNERSARIQLPLHIDGKTIRLKLKRRGVVLNTTLYEYDSMEWKVYFPGYKRMDNENKKWRFTAGTGIISVLAFLMFLLLLYKIITAIL